MHFRFLTFYHTDGKTQTIESKPININYTTDDLLRVTLSSSTILCLYMFMISQAQGFMAPVRVKIVQFYFFIMTDRSSLQFYWLFNHSSKTNRLLSIRCEKWVPIRWIPSLRITDQIGQYVERNESFAKGVIRRGFSHNSFVDSD